MTKNNIITIKNLSKSYTINNESCKILNELNLEIKAGDRIGIIGNSGEGKTTLLRCIGGLEEYDSGEITYKDDINKNHKGYHDFMKTVGFVFQNYGLFPNKTIKKNITFPLTYIKKLDKTVANTIAESKLSALGILDKQDEYPNHLSGGQKQRVSIARALAINPSIILFDEPTSALDPKTTNEVINIIKQIDKTITIIIVSHSVGFIKKVCNKVAFLKQGKILEYGKTSQVLSNPNTKELKHFLEQ